MCYYTGRVVSLLVSCHISQGVEEGTGADFRDQNMRESFVVPVNSQRKEMAGNVILYVSPLSLLVILSSHNPSSE